MRLIHTLTLLFILAVPVAAQIPTYSGNGAPAGACGGTVAYIDTANNVWYECQSGAWALTLSRTVFRSGAGAPSNALGKDGDYYVNTTPDPNTIYQRASGTYTLLGSLLSSSQSTTLAAAVPNTRTVNGMALSSNVTLGKADVGLGNVPNVDATQAGNITQDSTHRFATDAEKTTWNAKASAVSHFNAAGPISAPTKRWIATVSPSTANGYSIDISSASFSSILNVQIIAIRNTSTVTSSPNVSIKTISTSAIVVNVIEGNPTLINILGSNVPLGLSQVFASTTGLTLQVMVEGS